MRQSLKKLKSKYHLPSLIPLISMISLNIWMTGTGWSTLKLIKLCRMIWGPVIVASPVTVPVSGASATRVWRRGPWPWGWPIVCGSIMLEKFQRGKNIIRKILFLIVAKSFSWGQKSLIKVCQNEANTSFAWKFFLDFFGRCWTTWKNHYFCDIIWVINNFF